MNNSSKKYQKKKKDSKIDDFTFEKKSKDGKKETIEELKTNSNHEDLEEILDEEEEIEVEPESKKRTINVKILEERDIQYKEAPPPNFSPYFHSYLHYKNSKYKVYQKLVRNEYNY